MESMILKTGLHIVDRKVLLGVIPEVAPSLATDGYAVSQSVGGMVLIPQYMVVYVDLEVAGPPPADQNPVAELSMYGYVSPPSVGAQLLSDWQKLSTVVVQDTFKPTVALVPVVGFDRFHCIVTASTGSPISVRIRIRAISNDTAEFLKTAGIVSSNQVKGKTLANVTNGTDGTYYYYVDLTDKDVMTLQLALDGGNAGVGPTGVTATVEATLQDDGTQPDLCTYFDVTNQAYGVVSLNAAPGAVASTLWIPGFPQLLSCCKYTRVKIVAQTNGPDTGDWLIYERSK